MKLINFINQNKNWRDLLMMPPYSFTIKEQYPYYLIKYGFGITQFQEIGELGLEARGLIVKDCGDSYVEVCHGLNKFFNMEEPCAATIDWQHSFQVLEKMDGSNIRLWYDGEWHISTLGTIFADNEEYGVMFKKVCSNFLQYVANLDTNCTYVYELIGPLNRIVVRYDEMAAYFICKRNLISGLESLEAPEAMRCGIRAIPAYSANNMEEALHLRDRLPENVEGMVVCDSHFNRVKLKTDWYLELHKIRGNGVCTVKRVVKMWQAEELDDFIAAFPEYNEFVESVVKEIRTLVLKSEAAFYFLYENGMSRKEFAAKIQNHTPLARACCYALLDKKYENAASFFKGITPNKLVKYIEDKVQIKEFGKAEDDG